MSQKIIIDFVESINTANLEKLCQLISADHEFVDSRGNSMTGKTNLRKAWMAYFELFPDYKIEITDTLQNESFQILLGFASGTYKPKNHPLEKKNFWKVPATWKVKVIQEKIKLWQVFADNSLVLEIVHRNMDPEKV